MVSTTVIVCVIVTAVAVAVALYMMLKKDKKDANPNAWTDMQKVELTNFFASFPLDPHLVELTAHYKDCLTEEFMSLYSYDKFKNNQKETMVTVLQHTTCMGLVGKWDEFLKNFFNEHMTGESHDCTMCISSTLEASHPPTILFNNNKLMAAFKYAMLECDQQCKH